MIFAPSRLNGIRENLARYHSDNESAISLCRTISRRTSAILKCTCTVNVVQGNCFVDQIVVTATTQNK